LYLTSDIGLLTSRMRAMLGSMIKNPTSFLLKSA